MALIDEKKLKEMKAHAVECRESICFKVHNSEVLETIEKALAVVRTARDLRRGSQTNGPHGTRRAPIQDWERLDDVLAPFDAKAESEDGK